MQKKQVVLLISFIIIASSLPVSLFFLKKAQTMPKDIEVTNVSPSISQWLSYDQVFEVDQKEVDANIRVYHAPNNLTLYQGEYAKSDQTPDPLISDADFMSSISLSDNKYGYIVPEPATSLNTVDNYYIYPLKLATSSGSFQINYAHWLSPQPNMYLAIDSVIEDEIANLDIIQTQNIDDISRSVFAINDIYLLPSADYYTFETTSESASFSMETGGVSLYNASIYQLYRAFSLYDIYIQIPFQYRQPLDVWFDAYYPYEPYGLKLLTMAISDGMNLPENQIFFSQIRTMTTYEDFLFYLNIDLDKGLSLFSHFNPNFVHEIEGIVSLEFINSSTSSIQSYSIDAWNYASESWISVYTRTNTNGILESGRLLDEFKISTNAWQYIYDASSESNQFKWRINVESTGDLTVLFGGLWTKCNYDLLTFDLDVTFQVPDIVKSDLYTKPEIVLEYTTSGLQDANEKINIVVPIENQTGDPKDFYVMILPESAFYPSPYRDARRGYPLPDHIIQENTSVHVRIRGFFSRYTREGVIQTPLVSFDKISVKYQYYKPVQVLDYGLVAYNRMQYIDHVYIFNITNEITELTINHPEQYIFLGNGLQLVEGPDKKDITEWWIKNPALYGQTFVNITKEVIYFEGYGEYRIWFRSPNYLAQSTSLSVKGAKIFNATLQLQPDYSDILITVTTSFQCFLSEIYGLNGFSRMSSSGNFTIFFTGYNKYTAETQKLQIQGYQSNYTVLNPVNPDETVLKFNKFEYNQTFVSSDIFFGEVLVEYLWQNEDGSKIGYDRRWINIPSYSYNTPYSYFISPTYTIYTGVAKWGIHKNNTVIVYTSHPNTQSVKINVTHNEYVYHLNISLYNYQVVYEEFRKWQIGDPTEIYTSTYHLVYENGGLPSLENIPASNYKYYWFRPILVTEIATLPRNDIEGQISVVLQGICEASFFPDFYEAYAFQMGFYLVSRPFFLPDEVSTVPIDTYLTVGYLCISDEIQAIEIWINQTIQEEKVITLNRTDVNNQYFLQRGHHYYNIPYQFAFAGDYCVKYVVYDTLGNVATYYTNRFYIEDTDTRSIFWRILDNIVEVSILWLSVISGGFIIYIKKKGNSSYSAFSLAEIIPFDTTSDPFQLKHFYQSKN